MLIISSTYKLGDPVSCKVAKMRHGGGKSITTGVFTPAGQNSELKIISLCVLKIHRHLILFWFLGFTVMTVRAQKLDSIRPAYISVKEGLPDATINAICQDEDGFLWIGTNFGLSRYDGVEFKNFYHSKTAPSLPGNYIKSIQILPGRRLIIATSTGLCLFNTETNTFKNLLVTGPAKMFPFENNFTMVKVDKQGAIWAASQTSLYQLDQNLNIQQVKRGANEQEFGFSLFLYVESINPLPDGMVLFRLLKDKKFQFYIYTPSNNQIALLNRSKQPPMWGVDDSNIRDLHLINREIRGL